MLRQKKTRLSESGKSQKRLNAFTLAETLLTLALLGVLSLLVMGGLKFTSAQQYPIASALFKNELATAMATMNIDVPLNGFDGTEKFREEFQKYYGIVEDCATKGACFAANYRDAGGNTVEIKDYDMTFKTNSGATVAMSYVANDKPLSTYTSQTASIDQANGSFEISNAALNYVTGVYDLNGTEGPNIIGQDMGIIMPAVALNKTADGTTDPSLKEYLTIDSSGSVYVKSAASSSDSGTKVVDENGKFTAPASQSGNGEDGSEGGAYQCPNQFIQDSFGECTICPLTSAGCAAQGANKKLNKEKCICEYDTSCPKNKIQNEAGECVCANAKTLTCNPVFSVKDTENDTYLNQDTCTCQCKAGSALRCKSNGGVWDSETCSCICDSQGATAESACQAQTNNNGYAYADPNQACACVCKSESEITQLIKDKGASTSTKASNNVELQCFACNGGAGSNMRYIADYEKGVCSLGCSVEKVDEYAKWVPDENGTVVKPDAHLYYDPPAMEEDGRLVNPEAGCTETCKLEQSTCDALTPKFLEENGLTNKNTANQCPFLHKYYKPCSYSCNYYGLYKANCDSNRIKLVPNRTTCQCEPQVPDGWMLNHRKFIYYEYHGICRNYFIMASIYNGIDKANGKKNNPYVLNSGNPFQNKVTYHNLMIREYSAAAYDPIVLTPFETRTGMTALEMTSPTGNGLVNVKFAAEDTEPTQMTWLQGSPGVRFLTKGQPKFTSVEENLFSDVISESGYGELREKYDSNNDGLVNELDDDYDKLYVWYDLKNYTTIDSGEQIALKDDMVIEIDTNPGIGSQKLADKEGTEAGQIGSYGTYKQLEQILDEPSGKYFLRVPYHYNPFDEKYTDAEKLLEPKAYTDTTENKRIVYTYESKQTGTIYLFERETKGYVVRAKIETDEEGKKKLVRGDFTQETGIGDTLSFNKIYMKGKDGMYYAIKQRIWVDVLFKGDFNNEE